MTKMSKASPEQRKNAQAKDASPAIQARQKKNSVAETNYTLLKRKLKYLIYEQEALAEDLRACRRKVLRLTNEKEYLLDRLLRYEDVGSSDEDAESASEDEAEGIQAAQEAIAGRAHAERKAAKHRPSGKGTPKASGKRSAKSSDATKCRQQPCKLKPLKGLAYCRKHAPLDADSGFIYCTYRDAATKAQTCKQVIRRGMHVPICIAHRRADQSPGPSPSRPAKERESKSDGQSPDAQQIGDEGDMEED